MGFNVLFSDLKEVIKINIPIRKVFPALGAKNWQCSEKFLLLENTLLGLDESGAWVERTGGRTHFVRSLAVTTSDDLLCSHTGSAAVTDSVVTSFCLIVSVFIRTSSEQNSSGLSCAYLQLISPDVFGVKRKLLVIILILFNCNFYFTLGFSLRVCSAFLM